MRSLSLCEIDIHVEVRRVDCEPAGAPPRNGSRGASQGRTVAAGETGGKLADDRLGEPSADIRGRIEGARQVQKGALRRLTGWSQRHRESAGKRRNACTCGAGTGVGPAEVRVYCKLDEGGRSLVRSAMQQLGMSARAFHRTASVSP